MDGRRSSTTGRGGVGGANSSGGGGSTYGGVAGGPGSLDWVVGLRVRVNTIIDDTYEGTVFAYDPLTHTVALCHTPANAAVANNGTTPAQLADYRILKISFIKDVSVLSGPAKNSSGSGGQVTGGPFANVEPKIGLVTINNVLDREKTTVKQEAERSVTRGVGVTKEAQEIFDGLSRIMPCRWQGKTIIVMDMVCVLEPYTTDSVKAGAGQQGNSHAVQRVKKVLEGERKRLLEVGKKSQPGSTTPAASTPGPSTNPNTSTTSNSTTPAPAVPPVGERKGG